MLCSRRLDLGTRNASLIVNEMAILMQTCLHRIRTTKLVHSTYLERICFQRTRLIKSGDSVDDCSAQARQRSLRHRKTCSAPNSVPPLPEQRAIAGALSDVDALLGALEQLIAKKRDLKQAAMQQLLTGQTRLPGFSGDWEP